MLREKNIFIVLTIAVKRWLADEGFDEKMGARPLKRLFAEKIKKPLSKEILFGKLKNGGEVHVDLDPNNELTFTFKPL